MSEKQETIADIVAEFRSRARSARKAAKQYDEYRKDIPSCKLHPHCNKVADIKREADSYDNIADRIEDAHKREIGHGAKMREALKLCGSQMCELCKDLTLARSMINKGLMGVSCHPDKCKPYQAANAALAEPRRNCDVGTADEQNRRFELFCIEHRTYENGCGDCPCKGVASCELAWAQMPYEEGGAK